MATKNYFPNIDTDLCTMCGACELECPVNAIAIEPCGGSTIIITGACTGCLACESVCPVSAICVESL